MPNKGFVFACLFMSSTLASADAPLQPYAPLKVVAILPDTAQALFWDEAVGEYRLGKVGSELEGWRVVAIAAHERRVVVAQDDIRDELLLTRLPRPGALVTYREREAVAESPSSKAVRPSASPQPIDPFAAGGPSNRNAPSARETQPPRNLAAAPLDPYGNVSPPRAANDESEPLDPYEPVDAVPVAPDEPTVIDAPPERMVERHTVRRADLDREINDFDRLFATVKVAAAPNGGFVVTRLDPQSWIASLGVRQGDVVRTIAGERVSTLEDASRVYARIRSAGSVLVELERGQPARRVTVQLDIR